MHYFYNEQGLHPTDLNQYCGSIHTYPATSIDSDKGNTELTERINSNNYPLLVEGLSCIKLLSQISDTNRVIIVRMRNEDAHLTKIQSNSFINKIFRAAFNKDSSQDLPSKFRYVFGNEEEAESFRSTTSFLNINYLPVFIPSQSVSSEPGMGIFCLYHGDLSYSSNQDSAIWLISKVFNDINTPLVIAGKNPGKKITKLAGLFTHLCLISNPSTTEMDELIKKAHINILPSFSKSRPELKLVHALLAGKHCVTNEEGVAGTKFSDACHIGKNAAALKSIILQLYRRPFEENEIELRKKIFRTINKETPVNTLMRWLYG